MWYYSVFEVVLRFIIAIHEINKSVAVAGRASACVGEKAVSKFFSGTGTSQHRLGVMCRVLGKLYPHLVLVPDIHASMRTCTHTHTHTHTHTPCDKIPCKSTNLSFAQFMGPPCHDSQLCLLIMKCVTVLHDWTVSHKILQSKTLLSYPGEKVLMITIDNQ